MNSLALTSTNPEFTKSKNGSNSYLTPHSPGHIVLDFNSQLSLSSVTLFLLFPFFLTSMQWAIWNWSDILDISFDWKSRTVYRPWYPEDPTDFLPWKGERRNKCGLLNFCLNKRRLVGSPSKFSPLGFLLGLHGR